MHPVLIEVGRLSIYSFGFTLALSFLVGIYLAARRAKRFGVDPQIILDLSVYLILTGVVGSRLLYVVFHLGEFESFLDVFSLWEGGATFYGGLLLAVAAAYLFLKKKRVDFILTCDILSPSLALGIMLTRVGCYLSGCCFGKETTLPWGVIFPANSAAGAYARSLAADGGGAVALHPAQLYASLYGAAILVFLMLSEKRLARRGATFGALLLLYGIFRFTLDFFRYYEDNMRVLMDITLNQLISVAFVIVGTYLLVRRTELKTAPAASA